MAFSAMAELCPCTPRPLGGSSDPGGRAMFADKIEAIGRAAWASLDGLARAVWQDLGAGTITSAEASSIIEAIEARRRALRRPAGGLSVPRVQVVHEGAERPP